MSHEERVAFEDKLMVEMPDVDSDSNNETLYGCLGSDSSSLDACAPSCLNGYKFLDTPVCKTRVYTRSAGVLTLKNNVVTDRAYIYLDAGDTISVNEKRMLCKKHNIREVYLYHKIDGSRYEHTETLNLRPKSQSRTTKSVKSAGLSPMYIMSILFVIFIIILICCLIVSMVRSVDKSAPVEYSSLHE